MGGRCRIGFLNVQGLTVAKSVEIKNLMMVSGGDGRFGKSTHISMISNSVTHLAS